MMKRANPSVTTTEVTEQHEVRTCADRQKLKKQRARKLQSAYHTQRQRIQTGAAVRRSVAPLLGFEQAGRMPCRRVGPELARYCRCAQAARRLGPGRKPFSSP